MAMCTAKALTSEMFGKMSYYNSKAISEISLPREMCQFSFL